MRLRLGSHFDFDSKISCHEMSGRRMFKTRTLHQSCFDGLIANSDHAVSDDCSDLSGSFDSLSGSQSSRSESDFVDAPNYIFCFLFVEDATSDSNDTSCFDIEVQPSDSCTKYHRDIISESAQAGDQIGDYDASVRRDLVHFPDNNETYPDSFDVQWIVDRCCGDDVIALELLETFGQQGTLHLTDMHTALANQDLRQLEFHVVREKPLSTIRIESTPSKRLLMRHTGNPTPHPPPHSARPFFI
jgi:hypothetical protein